MKTDRELLELAAKAGGIELVGPVEKHIVQFDERHKGGFIVNNERGGQSAWNPLTDDGDGARLEAALCLDVQWDVESVSVETDRTARPYHHANELFADHRGDKQAARRRASVRVAAAIGEQP